MRKIDQSQGFVIIDTKDEGRILSSTFRYSKKQCIKDFLEGTEQPWQYWRDKWKFKCVNANQIIELNQ